MSTSITSFRYHTGATAGGFTRLARVVLLNFGFCLASLFIYLYIDMFIFRTFGAAGANCLQAGCRSRHPTCQCQGAEERKKNIYFTTRKQENIEINIIQRRAFLSSDSPP